MFKLHHIQLAVSCITGVQICKDNIVNAMMDTKCPISLAFEGDKVVIVSQGNVVFFTTTPEYSTDVQKFLDLTRSLRNMRKDVKGMEKQAKVYSAPDTKVVGDIPAVPKRPLPSVDLSTLKAGDKVRLRKGVTYLVIHLTKSPFNCTKYPYWLLLDNHDYIASYDEAGNFLTDIAHHEDIIEIISQ